MSFNFINLLKEYVSLYCKAVRKRVSERRVLWHYEKFYYFCIVKWRDAGVVQRGRLKIYCVKSRVSSNLTPATIHLMVSFFNKK